METGDLYDAIENNGNERIVERDMNEMESAVNERIFERDMNEMESAVNERIFERDMNEEMDSERMKVIFVHVQIILFVEFKL